MKSLRLTSMTLDALRALRDKIDKAIGKRVAKERKHFEGKLAELVGLDGGGGGFEIVGSVGLRGRKGKRAKAKIKYRSPKGEKWSGRGMTPLWMRPLLKGGKKKEDFSVGSARKKTKGR